MQHDDETGQTNNRAKLSRYIFFGFVAVAAFFVLAEHRAHVVPFLPFLLLAACPLMHLFHHRGHKHDDEPRSDQPQSGGHRH